MKIEHVKGEQKIKITAVEAGSVIMWGATYYIVQPPVQRVPTEVFVTALETGCRNNIPSDAWVELQHGAKLVIE